MENKKLLNVSIKILEFIRIPKLALIIYFRLLIMLVVFLNITKLGALQLNLFNTFAGLYWVFIPLINFIYYELRDWKQNENRN
jgi:hypothetical protein